MIHPTTRQTVTQRPSAAGGMAPPVPQPPGFASGGPVDGYQPGAPGERKVQTQSGLVASIRQDQTGQAIQATLPAGWGLLPVAVALRGTITAAGTSFKAEVVGPKPQEVPVQTGSDGRVYVTLEAGAPLVVFDPRTLEYGLASGAVATPEGGWKREKMELLDANGARRYVVNEKVTPESNGAVSHQSTVVTWDGRTLAAQGFLNKEGQAAPQGARDLSGQIADGLTRYVNGPDRQSINLPVSVRPDRAIEVRGPGLADMAKVNGNGIRALMGDIFTPAIQYNRFQGMAATFVPFSSSDPARLFPQGHGQAPQGPAVPQLAPPEVRRPVLLPPGQPAQAAPGPFPPGAPVQPPVGAPVQTPLALVQTPLQRPAQPPVSAPVQAPVQAPVGAPIQVPVQPPASEQAPPAMNVQPPALSPARELAQRYPGVAAEKIQAALVLADQNPARAGQLLQLALTPPR